MSNAIRAQLPNRSYFRVLVTLAMWSLAIVFFFYEVLNWPYIGARFTADIPGKSIEVVQIFANGPAEKAGIVVGDKFVAIENAAGERYQMTGLEAIDGRHQLHSYEMTNASQLANIEIWKYIKQPSFTLETSDGKRVTLTPGPQRPLLTLPAKIFNSLAQSLIIVMIAAGIWAFAPRSLVVNLLVASGFGLALNNLVAMVLGSRELAKPDYLIDPLIFAGGIASLTFVYAMVALMWHYPTTIHKFPFGKLVAALAVFTLTAQYFQYFEFPVHPYQFPNLLPLPLAITLAILQWLRTRGKPIERASVMWFMLSIFGVSSFVMLFYSIPIMLKFPPIIGPHLANFSLSFIFIGIAFGTLKYRLFDMQRIWWRAIIWFVGGLVVLLADVLLISRFNFSQDTALPVALLLAGWAYFPIRQMVLEYFVSSKDTKIADHVPDMVSRFSGVEGDEEFQGRFVSFIRKVFGAVELGQVGRMKLDNACLEDNGLALRIPNVSGTGSLQLIGKAGGRQLFSLSDTLVADSFVRLVRNMGDASKHEFEKLQQERQRIVRDLHDDVGGRLLSMIYNAPDQKNATDARETLGALKESLIVIEDTQSVDFSVAWEQISEDAASRFERAGFAVKLTQNIESERVFSAREYINFKRIMQEIVSNAIKYGAKEGLSLSVNVTFDGLIELMCKNQIAEQLNENFSSGRGLANIRKRLEEIGGDMSTKMLKNDPVSFEIRITLPLND